MSSARLKVHFDGEIFLKQQHGGISMVFDRLISHLGNNPTIEGHVHLCSKMETREFPDSICVEKYPSTKMLHWPNSLKRMSKLVKDRSYRKHFQRFGRGVFHSTYYTTYSTPLLKQVLTLHDMIFEDHPEYFPNDRKREQHIRDKRACIESADAIVCVSEFTRKRLQYHYPALAKTTLVRVVHNGCNLPSPHSGGTSGDLLAGFSPMEPFLLHVGSRHPHKNFDRVLAALSHGGLSQILLVSVGGGEWSSAEQQLIKRLGLENRVFNIPVASEGQLEHAYRDASAVIVPSITEGFGLPLIEAMTFGCSVASSSGGSLPEVGGDVPFYFDPFNEEEMETAIAKALTAKDCRDLQEKALLRAKKFSWSNCASQYAELYHEVCP